MKSHPLCLHGISIDICNKHIAQTWLWQVTLIACDVFVALGPHSCCLKLYVFILLSQMYILVYTKDIQLSPHESLHLDDDVEEVHCGANVAS